MGKRIISQRRGRGTSTYRVPTYSFRPKIEYKKQNGKVVDILANKLMASPLAKIEYDDKTQGYIIAPEGIAVGEDITGKILSLSEIPEGSKVFGIELRPNSGPKLCRAAGSFATLISKTKKECILMLPSKKMLKVHPECMASIGIPAGEGRKEKPWVKAGKRWIAMHRRGKLYPRTTAKAMNSVDHPFGGGGMGRSRSPASRNAPPGRKVGHIAPKRTGKKR
ncbi:MAG: 50S ribosomal protein L2 [Candidatus Aenigmarchaeota archaeon]|nr:50S ribosomal protein L2 [Candidatus Aenigmarchaeota archaeon]